MDGRSLVKHNSWQRRRWGGEEENQAGRQRGGEFERRGVYDVIMMSMRF